MERYPGRRPIFWIAIVVLVVMLMTGSCLVGLLLAPRLDDVIDLGGIVSGSATPTPLQLTRAPAQLPVATPTPIPPVLLEDADAEERLVAAVYERVSPSVVHIRVVQRVAGGQMPRIDIPGWPESPTPPDDFYQQGQGSGFVWDSDGHIVTNYHVVQDAERVEVTFLDGTRVTAEVVGSDPDSDLAVLKVDAPASGLHPVSLGDSDALFVGQRAIAIGNPFGQEWTLTTGVISALGRVIQSGVSQFSIPEMIQTDAAINPGNSGGPLLDRDGRVIGVNTMIISQWQSSSGVGFAVPVNVVRQVVPVLIAEGRYAYAWLGVVGQDLSREAAEAMELAPDQRGALVIEVTEGGPAENAGLHGAGETIRIDGAEARIGGDVIIAIEDHAVTGMDDLIVYLVKETRPGQDVTLRVLREGREQQIDVTLGERPR